MTVLVQFLFISLFLGNAGGEGTETGERQKLLEKQKSLNARIEMLRREQEYLLFQKSVYATDSKYLILRVARKTGQLKYKNRVLRDFRILSATKDARRLQQGEIMLTRKIDGARERYSLVFGRSLVLHPKGAAAYRGGDIPGMSLPKKDFAALFYALENGARAYVLP
jgi:hypothetical protein